MINPNIKHGKKKLDLQLCEALPVKLSRKTIVIGSKSINSTKQNINSHSNAVIMYIKSKPAFQKDKYLSVDNILK